tara:strand:- start:2681 stop:4723 length:2043 start_codon:yes stop_codon:yes gene_type:complete
MSRWYRTGTVSITTGTKNVTGTGTYFSAVAKLKPGDLFTYDGGKFYEIDTVGGDAALTLVDNYAEATLSGSTYACLSNFNSTLTSALAAQLADLLNKWQTREDQMMNWLGGTGQVTVSDAVGNARLVDTPAKQNADVAAAIASITDVASLAPTPGGVPLANSEGAIDLGWLGGDAVAQLKLLSVQLNHIGTPGLLGYGVGICPTIPAGYTALAGTYALGSDEYGNYQYSDGSIMCWVPAFYYRIAHVDNPTYAAYGVNSVDTQPLSAYADTAAANAAGFALHRAFIDGGVAKPGFMYDKYQCSNNAGTASSVKNGNPLSSNSAHNPFGGLTGAPANNYGGAWAAAKTRGAEFFVASRFMRGALALLALAHGQAATSSAHCAWYDAAGVTNFPKGCNNDALGDANDISVSYTSDGYSNAGQTGSGVPFAKTTHNGQACGVADLNGNMWMIEQGVTCVASTKTVTAATQANPVVLTVTAHGLSTGSLAQVDSIAGMTELNGRVYAVTVIDVDTVSLDGVDGVAFSAYSSGGTLIGGVFHIAAEATAMRDFTGSNSLASDHFGATGVAAMMQPFTPPFRTDYPENSYSRRVGSGAAQVLSAALSGDDWLQDSLGLPQPAAISSGGTSLFGQDYLYQYVRNELCLLSGAYWSNGSSAGAWASSWLHYRTNSYSHVGFRAASYPV